MACWPRFKNSYVIRGKLTWVPAPFSRRIPVAIGLYYIGYDNLVSIDQREYFSISFGREEGGKRYVSGDKQDQERASFLPEKGVSGCLDL